MLANDPAAEMTIQDPEASATKSGFSYLTDALGGAFNTFANQYATAAATKLAGVNSQPAKVANAVSDPAKSDASAPSFLRSPWFIGGVAVAVGLVLVVALRKR